MNRFQVWLILLGVCTVLLSAGHSSVGDEKQSAELPGEFRVTSHMFRLRSTEITWTGKALKFERRIERRTEPERLIEPSAAAWQKFWKDMDAVGVWKWKSEYIDPTTVDGHSWSVRIVHGGKKVDAMGRNLTPPRFEDFENAVHELIGGKKQQSNEQ